MSIVRVVVIGAGPIGLGVAREIAKRPGLALHGIVDVDPKKKDLLVESAKVRSDIEAGAHVAVISTASSLKKIEPLLHDVIGHHLHVVSTCEELAWPWSQKEIADRIHDSARKAGVAVLGTGVNPGFVMDALPLLLTAPCSIVKSVRVERVQDAATRRRPFQDKVGVGMDARVVEPAIRAGTMGHVGLRESAVMLGARLGFPIDSFSEEVRVICADDVIERNGRRVERGQAIGVEQVGRGSCKGVQRVELFFRAVFGQDESHDRIIVDGTPPMDVVVKGGIPGDIATCAIVANAIVPIMNAKPGLRTMAEVPVAWSL